MILRQPPPFTLFPYTTLFRSLRRGHGAHLAGARSFLGPWSSLPLSHNGSQRGAKGLQPVARSEEHTSELQSRRELVCRLLLEKIMDQCRHIFTDTALGCRQQH